MALNVKQLMIGDWVSIPHINKIGTVYRIDRANGKGNGWAAVIDGDYHESRLEPIPLTEDILKANGFKYHSGKRNMYGVETSPYYSCKGSPYIFCDGNPFAVWFEDEVPIRYVHELQHVLRLCGVQKEIVIKPKAE